MHARAFFLGGDENLLGQGGGVLVSWVVHELGQDIPAILGMLKNGLEKGKKNEGRQEGVWGTRIGKS